MVRVCLVRLGGVASPRASCRSRCRVAAARHRIRRLRSPARRSPRPPRPRAGAAASVPACALGNGDPNAECCKASSKLLGARLSAMDLLVQQKPQHLRQERRVRRRHRPVPRPRQGGLPERPRRRTWSAAGYCARARPGRLQLRADPGQERERLLRELRRPGGLRPHAPRRELLRDLLAGLVPGGPRRPAACGQRLRLSLPGADRQDELQAAPLRIGRLHARLDGARRGRGLLRAGRLPGPRPVPGAARDEPGAGAVRDVARRQRRGTPAGPARPGPSAASTARVRRAAARTTPRTSTPCSSTRPGSYQVCANTGACCTVEVER